MSRRTQENILAGILLATFVVLLVLTLGYSARARLVPLPVAILGVALAVAQLLWQNLRSGEEPRVNFLDLVGSRGVGDKTAIKSQGVSDAVVRPDQTGAVPVRKPGGELSAFGIVAVLLALVFVVGPLPAVLLFTAGYLSLTKHCSPGRALLYGLACTAVLYALFGFTLGVQLNRGLLAAFLVDYVDF
jgi:hypothetical protein